MAVLHEGRHDQLRILDRHEPDEPGVGLTLRVLRGPGLPGQGPAAEAPRVGGPVGLVHDPGHGVHQLPPPRLGQVQRPVHARGLRDLPPGQVRDQGAPPRGQRAVEDRLPQERLVVLALADGQVQHDAGAPAPRPVTPVEPLRGLRDVARELVREVDPRGPVVAQPLRPVQHGVQPQPQTELVEEDVAALLYGVGQVEGAVALGPPAPEEPAAVAQGAAAGDLHPVADGDQAPSHALGGHHQLPRRARRVGGPGHPIQDRLVGVVPQPLPHLLLHPAHEGVGVEARVAVEGEHAAGPGVHRQHGPLAVVREDRVREGLQREVQRQAQVLARRRLHPFLGPELPHHRPQGGHLHVAHAGVAAEPVLVRPLQSGLAHHPAGVVAREGGVGELASADLSHVAGDVRRDVPGGVPAARSHLHHRPAELRPALLDGAHLPEGRVLVHHERSLREAAVLLHQGGRPLLVQPQVGGQPVQRRPDGVLPAGEQRDRVAGDVLRHDPPGAIVDGAPGGGHRDGPEPVLLRLEHVAAGPQDLVSEEGPRQDHHHDAQEPPGPRRPAAPPAARLLPPPARADHVTPGRSAPAPPGGTTPPSPARSPAPPGRRSARWRRRDPPARRRR